MIDPYNGAPFVSVMIACISRGKSRDVCNKLKKGGCRVNTTIEKQQIITFNTEQWKMYSKLENRNIKSIFQNRSSQHRIQDILLYMY